MVNRICEDTAGYELWSTSGSSKGMADSAHGVPRVGALAQLNSHFDVGMPVGLPCRPVPNVFRNGDAVQLPPVRKNMGTGSLLHSHSVRVLQNKTTRSLLTRVRVGVG